MLLLAICDGIPFTKTRHLTGLTETATDILLFYYFAIGWSQDVAQAAVPGTNFCGGEKTIGS
jgi:hypothetical protein